MKQLFNVCAKAVALNPVDLVPIQLREKLMNRQTYAKVYQSIWGASGGWSVIACPHGIVYSLKFNLQRESQRDFKDLCLSWKHRPILECDSAHDTETGGAPGNHEGVQCNTVKRLFADMRENNYFLNNMAPSTHMFLMRNLMEHRNTFHNTQFKQIVVV